MYTATNVAINAAGCVRADKHISHSRLIYHQCPVSTRRSSGVNFTKGRSPLVVCMAVKPKSRGQEIKTSKRTDNDSVFEPVDSLVSSPTAYAALGVIYTVLALPIAFFPHAAANLLFGAAAEPHDFLHEPLFRLLSTGLLSSAASAFALKVGASQGSLNRSYKKRLELGLILFATVNTLLATSTSAQPDSVLTFPAYWSLLPVFGLTMAAAWGGYGKASEYGLSLKRAGPLPAIKNFQDDTANLPNTGGINSALYAVLTAGFFAAGFAYLAFPEASLEAVFNNVKGNECVFLWRGIGAALVSVVPTISYSLKEAAENDRLGEKQFKLLNVGLSGAALGHLLVLAPLVGGEYAGPFLPALLGTWGTAFAASAIGLTKSSDE